MKSAVLIFSLCLAASLQAKGKHASKTAATPAPTPAATAVAAPAVAQPAVITLKDGQIFKGHIVQYDAYFLEAESLGGVKANIPLSEIAEIEPGDYIGDIATLRKHLSSEKVEVTSDLSAKDSKLALQKALWPGFVIHGWGYRAAGNQDMFLSLVGGEIFGVLVGGFGAIKAADGASNASEIQAGVDLAIGGASLFAVTWLWDVVGAPHYARSFNAEHGLSLSTSALPGGALASMKVSF